MLHGGPCIWSVVLLSLLFAVGGGAQRRGAERGFADCVLSIGEGCFGGLAAALEVVWRAGLSALFLRVEAARGRPWVYRSRSSIRCAARVGITNSSCRWASPLA